MTHPAINESFVDRTYNQIKRMILNGELEPGQRLRYKEMVETLQVSPTPIKIAFTRLEEEGLVVSVPHRGTTVRGFSHKDNIELFQVRSALETLAVKLASEIASPEEILILREINGSYKKYLEARNRKKAIETDYLFHAKLYEFSANSRLRNLLNFSNIQMLSISEKSDDFFSDGETYFQNHEAIIDAIEEHDAEKAQANMNDHLSLALNQILKSGQTE